MKDTYFATSDVYRRSDLVSLPRKFGLDLVTNKSYFIKTAADIYKEVYRPIILYICLNNYDCVQVMRDPLLTDAYGETKLGWIRDLTSSECVIAIINQATHNSSVLVLNVCLESYFYCLKSMT